MYRFYVRFWEAQYDRNGEEGIRHELNSAHSPEKKLSIITPVLMGGDYRQTAGDKMWREAFVYRSMDQKI